MPASATMHTYLLVQNETSGLWEKLVDIKDYPAMGGSPEQIETTTLSDETSTFVLGVQSLPTFEFLANFDEADFTALESHKNKVEAYAIAFGKLDDKTKKYGSLGGFSWLGQLTAWAEGGGVNAAREMRISISVSKSPEFVSGTTGFSTVSST